MLHSKPVRSKSGLSSAMERLAVELHRRASSHHGKNQQGHELRNFERGLSLRRRQLFERTYFHEKLGDQDKNVQIERNYGSDRISPAPAALETITITCQDGERQHDQ